MSLRGRKSGGKNRMIRECKFFSTMLERMQIMQIICFSFSEDVIIKVSIIAFYDHNINFFKFSGVSWFNISSALATCKHYCCQLYSKCSFVGFVLLKDATLQFQQQFHRLLKFLKIFSAYAKLRDSPAWKVRK